MNFLMGWLTGNCFLRLSMTTSGLEVCLTTPVGLTCKVKPECSVERDRLDGRDGRGGGFGEPAVLLQVLGGVENMLD